MAQGVPDLFEQRCFLRGTIQLGIVGDGEGVSIGSRLYRPVRAMSAFLGAISGQACCQSEAERHLAGFGRAEQRLRLLESGDGQLTSSYW